MKGLYFIFDTKCLDRDYIYGVYVVVFIVILRIFYFCLDVNSFDVFVLIYFNF